MIDKEVFETFQLLIAIIALIVAPQPIERLVNRIRAKMLVECEPFRPDLRRASDGWRIFLRNRSNRFSNIDLVVFPETQRNRVISRKLMTSNDGGLIVRDELSEGCVTLNFSRFYRARQVQLNVRFEGDDVPAFYSSAGRVHRKIANINELIARNPALQMTYTYHRMLLIVLVFGCATTLICGRIIYYAITT